MDQTGSERTLDVREIDGPPFSDIMAELDALGESEQLRLIVGHEPAPLYGVLEERGFTYESEQSETDEWHVRIRNE